MNASIIMATLLEEIRDRVIVQHVEPITWPPARKGESWQWGECRACLFTWRGMIAEHADDCPMWDIAAKELTQEKGSDR